MWVAQYTQGYDVALCAPTASGRSLFSQPAFTANPLGLAFDGAYMWMTNHGTNSVTKWRASSPGIAVAGSTYPVGTAPYGIAFDGASIWVANEGSGNVTKLLAATGAPLGTFSVGTDPVGVAF